MLLSIAGVIVGCDTQSKPTEKIWLFSLGESISQVKQTLTDNRYEYKQIDSSIGGFTALVDFLGVKWHGYDLSFNKDELEALHFMIDNISDKESRLTNYDIDRLVERLDSEYGENRQDISQRNEEDNLIKWTWVKGNIEILLVTMFDNELVDLLIYKHGSDFKERYQMNI